MAPRSNQPDRRRRLPIPQLRQALIACIVNRQPVCVHGAVGIGKTQSVDQLAYMYGLGHQVEATTRRESVDYTGVPWPDVASKQTVYMEPVQLAHATAGALAHPDRPYVIFWDEVNRAGQTVQNAVMNIILENKTGDYTLPDNVVHILAVNDASDSTGVVPMTEAMRNRVLHLYGRSDYASFKTWANGQFRIEVCGALTFAPPINYGRLRLRPEVIDYLDKHPDHLHADELGEAGALMMRHNDAFPTPRSWEFVSRVLDPSLCTDVETALIYGAIGPEIGEQFVAHLHLLRALVGKYQIDLNRIALYPTTEPVPTELTLQHTVASALSSLMTPQNAAAYITYLRRMNSEMQWAAILGALRRTSVKRADGTLDQSQSPLYAVGAFGHWITEHADEL